MPDITMCTSENCVYKNECFRVTAKPDKLQSYSNLEYTCNEKNGFCYYIKSDIIDKFIDVD